MPMPEGKWWERWYCVLYSVIYGSSPPVWQLLVMDKEVRRAHNEYLNARSKREERAVRTLALFTGAFGGVMVFMSNLVPVSNALPGG